MLVLVPESALVVTGFLGIAVKGVRGLRGKLQDSDCLLCDDFIKIFKGVHAFITNAVNRFPHKDVVSHLLQSCALRVIPVGVQEDCFMQGFAVAFGNV